MRYENAALQTCRITHRTRPAWSMPIPGRTRRARVGAYASVRERTLTRTIPARERPTM